MADPVRRGATPDASPDAAARTEFPCVDGARAVAAFAVVAHHGAGFLQHGYGDGALPGPVWAVTTALGQVGVAAFFVLSGFLLYRPYASAQQEGRRPPRVVPFWVRRVARILPGYWAALVGAIALGAIGTGGWRVVDHLVAFGLLQNYRSGYVVLFGLGVAWTLVIEVSFYLALPLIAWGLRLIERWTRLSAVRAQVLGLVLLGASSLAVRSYWLVAIRGASPTRGWFPVSQLGYWLPCYLDWFAVGMVLAVADASRVRGLGSPSWLRALASRTWVCWTIAAIWIWVLVRAGFPTMPWRAFGTWAAWWWYVCALIVGTLLVLPALVPGPRADTGRRLLSGPTMVVLGTVSYGVYLWNVTVYVLIETHRGAWWSPEGAPGYLAVAVAGTIAIAYLSFVLLERPVLELAHRAVGSNRIDHRFGGRPSWRIPLASARARLEPWCDGVGEPAPRILWATVLGVATASVLLGALMPVLRAACT